MSDTTALKNVLARSMETSMGILEPLLPDIAAMGDTITECFLGNSKLHLYSQIWLADYASNLFLHNPDRERPELPVVALTASNHAARNFRAQSQAGDCILLLDNSEEVGSSSCQLFEETIQALQATAQQRELKCLAITHPLTAPGYSSGQLSLQVGDYQQRQEAMLTIIHCLVAHCEYRLFGAAG